MQATIGVLLTGCGPLDGTDPLEAISAQLELTRQEVHLHGLALDQPQPAVIDHASQQPDSHPRHTLAEAHRLAAEVHPLTDEAAQRIDALVIPGGWGVAYQLAGWQPDGAAQEMPALVRHLILGLIQAQKPIAGLGLAALPIAKALADTPHRPILTLGEPKIALAALHEYIQQMNVNLRTCPADQVITDDALNLVTCPASLQATSPAQARDGVIKTITKLVELTALSLEGKGKRV